MKYLYINGVDDLPVSRVYLQGDRIRELGVGGSFWSPTPLPVWRDRKKSQNQSWVEETIPIALLGDDIIRAENKLWLAAMQSHRWHTDYSQENSLWLYWRVDNEPRAKRALIRKFEWNANERHNAYLDNGVLIGELKIERYYWEEVKSLSLTRLGMSLAGSAVDLEGVGTKSGRISQISLTSVPNAGTGVNEVWIGIREIKHGTADFEPFWDVVLGRLDPVASPATTVISDGTACSGKKVRIPFTDSEELKRRIRVKVGDVIAVGQDPRHYIGSYLVLGRIKATAADTLLTFQMRYGNSENEWKIAYENVIHFTKTDWHFMELGEVQIPAGVNRINAVNDIRNSEIELWAARREGNAILDVDRLVLIPSRHFAKVRAQDIQSGLTTLIELRTHEDDSRSVEISMTPDGPVYTGVPRARDFTLPHDGGMLVIAGQRSGVQICSDSAEVEITYHPRWISYMDRDQYRSNC